MRKGSVSMGRAAEVLYGVECGGEALVPANMSGVRTGLEGHVLLPQSLVADPGRARLLKTIPDGNRSSYVPEVRVEVWGREFILGVKGVGARVDMYNYGPMEITGMARTEEPGFTCESWFHENPWGGMSRQACLEDMGITEMSGPGGINGFHVCPMAAALELPPEVQESARRRFWYRKLDREGGIYQQFRLMPSDVRLYYQTEATLGRRTLAVLQAFGIGEVQELDAFADNYIRSGLAGLTLLPRTLERDGEYGFRGLDYDDVWMDKDSVIAPDGTMFFADIEGLERAPLFDEVYAEKRIRKQFDRNYYEFMYGLDCLLRERERMSARPLGWSARREGLAARLEMALAGDRFIGLERETERLNAVLRPKDGVMHEVVVKILDFDKEGE